MKRRLDVIYIQAAIAATLSFAHIHDVAVAAGQDGWQAWAYPVSVDLLLIMAWQRARQGGGAGPWFWFAVSLGASLGANIATAGVVDLEHPPMLLRVLVAGWPAIALFGGSLMAHGGRRTAPEDKTPEPVSEAPTEPLTAPEPPSAPEPRQQIVTAQEAADVLGVDASTVRGWASGRHTKRVAHHGYDAERRVLVDLAECRRVA